MSTSKGLIAVLLIGIAVVGAWWLGSDRDDDPTPSVTPEESGTTEAPPPLAAGGSQPQPRTQEDPGRVKRPHDPASEVERRRVRVRLPDGVDPKSVLVRLQWTPSPRFQERAVSTEPVTPSLDASSGALFIPIEQEGPGLPRDLRIVVAAPGHPTLIATVDALSTGPAEISIPPGVPFAGRVQDRDGHPVLGLRLLLTTAPTKMYAVFAEDLEFDRWLATPGSNQYIATVTRDDGTFSARVEPNRSYSVLADDERWFLEGQPWQVEVGPDGTSGVTRTASVAVTLRGNLTDAGTGKSLFNFHGSIERRGVPPERAFQFGWQERTVSPYRATWPRLDAATTEAYGVAFGAKGYLTEDATVRWFPGESLAIHDVRLRTVASAGGAVPVTIEVVDADGRPMDAPFFVEVRTPTESPTLLSTAPMTPSAAGRYTSMLPPGDADLRVALPKQHFRWLYSWHGRVLVEPGRDLVVKAQVPNGAPLTLAWSAPNAAERFPCIFFRGAGDATWWSEGLAPNGEEAGTKFSRWPSGTWEFARGEVGSKPAEGSATGTVTITAGQPATLELRSPVR